MRYLLDSDSLSDLYEPNSPGHRSISQRFAALADSDLVFVSILAFYELEYGYANAPDERKPVIRQRISDLQSDFSILPLTPEAARLFGTLKARFRSLRRLSKKASKTHNVDLMVAATAVTEGCTLIGADSIYQELQRLDPTLRIENWLAEPTRYVLSHCGLRRASRAAPRTSTALRGTRRRFLEQRRGA
jgi:predicted nucleic acid-binding protein